MTQYGLSAVGGDALLQRLPFRSADVLLLLFPCFDELHRVEFRHDDLVTTNPDELPVSILVDLITCNFARQPGTIVPTAWLGLLLLLPAVLSAGTAKSPIEETALFVGGQQGIHTYRIPSMVSTRNGTVLVFCEGRRYQVDDGSPTHIVLKRSLGNSGTL